MTDDDGEVEREFAMAALGGAMLCVDYGKAPWPAAYLDRLPVLRSQFDTLGAGLKPLYDAHRASRDPDDDTPAPSRTWHLPGGATLVIQAGFVLHVGVGEIGRGVVPEPDPLMCLASALCDAEQWGVTMNALTEAALWAIQRAQEWNVSVPAFE